MTESQPEQLAALWVDGRSITYLAAALFRHEGGGVLGWQLLVSDASPTLPEGEMEIRLKTRGGIALRGRARLEHAGQLAIRTDLLEGLEPLVEIGRRAS